MTKQNKRKGAVMAENADRVAAARGELTSYRDNVVYKKQLSKQIREEPQNSELLAVYEKCGIVMADIVSKIDRIEQPYKNLLYLRFIRGLSSKDVAISTGYCRRQLDRNMRKAVEIYSKIL